MIVVGEVVDPIVVARDACVVLAVCLVWVGTVVAKRGIVGPVPCLMHTPLRLSILG